MAKKAKRTDCMDKNCPVHGNLKLRGRTFSGIVTSGKMRLSAKVEWDRWIYIPKFERYERRKSKVIVHNPLCINAVEGDLVKIKECRPLSKRKNFVIVEKLGKGEFIKKESKYEALERKEKHAEVPQPKNETVGEDQ